MAFLTSCSFCSISRIPLDRQIKPKFLHADQKAELITDLAVATLVTTVAVLVILQVNGFVNLGQFSCIGAIGPKAAYCMLGASGALVLANFGKLLIQHVRFTNKLKELSTEFHYAYNRDLDIQRATFQGHIDEISSDLEAAHAQNETHIERVNELEEQLRERESATAVAEEADLSDLIRRGDHEAALTELNSEIKELKEVNATLIREKTELSSQTTELEEAKAQLAEAKATAEEKALSERITQINHEAALTELNSKIEELENTIEQLESENTELLSQIAELKGNLEELKASANELGEFPSTPVSKDVERLSSPDEASLKSPRFELSPIPHRKLSFGSSSPDVSSGQDPAVVEFEDLLQNPETVTDLPDPLNTSTYDASPLPLLAPPVLTLPQPSSSDTNPANKIHRSLSQELQSAIIQAANEKTEKNGGALNPPIMDVENKNKVMRITQLPNGRENILNAIAGFQKYLKDKKVVDESTYEPNVTQTFTKEVNEILDDIFDDDPEYFTQSFMLAVSEHTDDLDENLETYFTQLANWVKEVTDPEERIKRVEAAEKQLKKELVNTLQEQREQMAKEKAKHRALQAEIDEARRIEVLQIHSEEQEERIDALFFFSPTQADQYDLREFDVKRLGDVVKSQIHDELGLKETREETIDYLMEVNEGFLTRIETARTLEGDEQEIAIQELEETSEQIQDNLRKIRPCVDYDTLFGVE